MISSTRASSSQATRSVLVVGDGYVARNTLSSLVSRHGKSVDVVAGVSDPSSFEPMEGVRAIRINLWDREDLSQTLKREGNFCRVYLVLPGHADRLQMGWNGLEAVREAGILQVVLVSVLTAGTPLGDDIQKLGKVDLPPPPSSSSPPSSRPSSPCSIGSGGSPSSPAASPTPTLGTKPIILPPKEADPATCVRIQRRNVLYGWFPMKVKLVQISMPNLDPTARCGKPVMDLNKTHDNGIAELQKAFLGPYHQDKPATDSSKAPPTGLSSMAELRRALAMRQNVLKEEVARASITATTTTSPLMNSLLVPPPLSSSSSPVFTSQEGILAMNGLQTTTTSLSRPLPLPLPPAAIPNQSDNNMMYSALLRAVQEKRQALLQRPRWL